MLWQPLKGTTKRTTSISIMGEEVEVAYLDAHLDNRLDWRHNTDAVLKGQNRLYFLLVILLVNTNKERSTSSWHLVLSFSSRYGVKACPRFTLVWSLARPLSRFLFLPSSSLFSLFLSHLCHDVHCSKHAKLNCLCELASVYC